MLRRLLSWVAELAPLLAPLMIALFGATSVALLLLGAFQTALVLILGGLVSGIGCYWFVRKWSKQQGRKNRSFERELCNLLVLLGVIVWVGGNVLFTAQHVFTNRDPGVYAVTAAWLVKRDNLKLEASDVFSNTDGVEAYSAGFSPDPRNADHVAAQGLHVLPALMGLVGRITSNVHMLRLNVVFGGLALLALYGYGRQLVKPRWALLATTTVALTMPMLYFSRDTYTEPLALLFTFGGLALMWEAQKYNARRYWLLAGLVIGAGALTRIDALLSIAGVLLFLAIHIGLAEPKLRRRALVNATAAFVGMAIVTAIGMLDLYHLSPAYYISEWKNLRLEFLLLGAVCLFGAVFAVIAQRSNWIQRLDTVTAKWRSQGAFWAVIFAGLILASRPLWLTSYTVRKVFLEDGVTQQLIPERDFAEITVLWLVWYLGPIMTILGCFGTALIARRAFRDKTLLLLPGLFVIGGTALFYLTKPSIFPDQIWASRRLLPVILPGLAVFGAFGLQWLYQKRQLLPRIPGKTLATVLATLAVVGPLFVTGPLVLTREATWYPPLRSVCDSLPSDAAVLWVGLARTQLIEPTKSYCGKPAQGFGVLYSKEQGPSPALLANIAREARQKGYTPVIGLFSKDETLLNNLDIQDTTVVSQFSYKLIEQTHVQPPRFTRTIHEGVQLAVIAPDGSLRPLSAPN
ncbi:hypothetical protein E6P97_03195 [Patescibacteria group bacterium]|nr:MAG: hypothetical protein E6P97_03195 [Patescibacteria group bacterium]